MFKQLFPGINTMCQTPGGCLKVFLLFLVVFPLVAVMPPLALFFLLWYFLFCRFTDSE